MSSVLEQKLKSLPHKSGVYVMKDDGGNVIYVGKAKSLKNRVSQYFNKKTATDGYTFKVKAMVDKICDFEYYITPSEGDALALENNLIKKHQPFFNILLKDSKTYPYIRLDVKSDFPRVEVVRKVKNDGAKYFGPMLMGVRASHIVDIINTAFEIRTCRGAIDANKPAKRPCLNHSLGLCSAPCVGAISPVEYRLIVEKVIDFLNGNDTEVLRLLESKMQKAADEENFEKAVILRDEIAMVRRLGEHAVAEVPKNLSLDVFGFATNSFSGAISHIAVRGGKVVGVQTLSTIDAALDEGEVISSFMMQYYESAVVPKLVLVPVEFENAEEIAKAIAGDRALKIEVPKRGYKKRLLEMAQQNASQHLEKSVAVEKTKFDKTIGAMQNLRDVLGLRTLPKRIECYDISNTQGAESVASMTVAINGELSRKMYRKFKIRTVEGPNDFESLKEVIGRRLDELDKGQDESFAQKPNLILIDGGKGQLSATSDVLFARRQDIDIISLAEQFDEVFLPGKSQPVMLKRASVELRLLQNLRDEAHRFAITFHRNLRQKKALKSPLDEILGVGEVKKKALRKRFSTIEAIKAASAQELASVKGIDANLAERIYAHFHK